MSVSEQLQLLYILAINIGYIPPIYTRQSMGHGREIYISLHCVLLSDILLSMEGFLMESNHAIRGANHPTQLARFTCGVASGSGDLRVE